MQSIAKNKKFFGWRFFVFSKVLATDAGVAQLAEHVLGKDGVTGSIPVSSLEKQSSQGAAG